MKAYVMRLLGAVPEGGKPSPGGQRRPLHLGNGYAHA
jgi:hypothetical protein